LLKESRRKRRGSSSLTRNRHTKPMTLIMLRLVRGGKEAELQLAEEVTTTTTKKKTKIAMTVSKKAESQGLEVVEAKEVAEEEATFLIEAEVETEVVETEAEAMEASIDMVSRLLYIVVGEDVDQPKLASEVEEQPKYVPEKKKVVHQEAKLGNEVDYGRLENFF